MREIHIYRTQSKVVLTTEAAATLAERQRRLEQLVRHLRDRCHEEHLATVAALHQLAEARGIKDHPSFTRSWIHAYRREQSDGIPRDRKL